MDEHNVIVNVSDDPYKSLEDSIKEVRPYSSTCCIFRVPPRLRSVNEKAYTPTLVSIGPFHHGNKCLQMMEETKLRFLQKFFRRTNVTFEKCVKIVKASEERLRGCYRETFGLKDDDFVKIILVDAIFIVELFLTSFCQEGISEIEPELLDAEWVLREIKGDLLLLENQLPFFILEDIWKCATNIQIYEIFYDYFIDTDIGLYLKAENGLETIINSTPEHFVDLVRKLIYIPLEPRDKRQVKTSNAPSATELHQAGVTFSAMESSKSLFDISFSKGILKIPKWKIEDYTEIIFRNLIAFEQCRLEYGDIPYICHYRRLMDYLVNTSKDVDLLVKKKIIENWLGDSNDVSNMINKLGIGVGISIEDFYFADIFDGLNRHCEITCNKWLASLKQNHFNTPWAIISVIAAGIVIILTAIQTVFSIIHK